jgi:transcriptional regulator with PAS, ATPase and Fis domain
VLESYGWPGNVRELQNVLERLWVITDGELIDAGQVHKQLTKFGNRFQSPITVNELMPIQDAKELLEKKLIDMAFDTYPSVRKAAEALGLDHSNILRKAAKYGLQK